MSRLNELLSTARSHGSALAAPYAGALTPEEAHELLCLEPTAKLVDVRSRAELDFVGRIPGAAEVQFLSYPDNAPNGLFAHQVETVAGANKEIPLLFICRASGRSEAAAKMMAAAGFRQCFNVLEGFEDDKDENKQRNRKNGWRFAGLPWQQS